MDLPDVVLSVLAIALNPCMAVVITYCPEKVSELMSLVAVRLMVRVVPPASTPLLSEFHLCPLESAGFTVRGIAPEPVFISAVDQTMSDPVSTSQGMMTGSPES